MGFHDKGRRWVKEKRVWILCGLIGILLISIFGGCGKLSDDTSRPSNPVGTTGGAPRTYQPTASAGTYTLTVSAAPTTVLADMTNFAVLTAKLSDAAGRTVQGFPISFLTAGNIGWFYNETAGNFVSTIQELTNASGVATIRFYGSQSGSAVVEATADINSDNIADLVVNMNVTFIPGDPPSSAGSYSLELKASPSTIPADLATYSIISAKLRDSVGGSVENFTINFVSELGYLHNQPTPPATWSTTASGITNKDGGVSLYFYGARAGSALIQATVQVQDLVGPLTTTTNVRVTEGPGIPGDGVPGIFVSVDLSQQVIQADSENGLADPEEITITATVWDSTGDPVGAGVRVEFKANGTSGFAETDATGTATWPFTPGSLSIGSYSYTVEACTYGINPQQTQYCDSTSFTITVTPPEPETLDIVLTAVPPEIEVGKTTKIIATVKYQDQLMPGVDVGFRTGGLTTPATATVTTDSFGVAELTLTAGTTPGKDTIIASASTVLPSGGIASGNATTEVTIISVPATIITTLGDVALNAEPLSSVTPTIPLPIIAAVEDASGNRIEGITVTFTILTKTGCAGVVFNPPTSVTATTNAGGYAEPTMNVYGTANTIAPHCVYALEVAAGDVVNPTITGKVTITGF